MERNNLNEKLARYQRLDLIANDIIAETFKFRGTTYVPSHFTAEQFGRFVVGIGGDVVPLDACNIYELTLHYLRSGRPFGTWIEAGRIYFDFVEFFDDLGAALQRAKECEQVAIYDLVEEKCIFVD